MEDLSEFTSPVIEFKATHSEEKQLKLVDRDTGTDPLPVKVDISTETNEICNKETQTVSNSITPTKVDERALAAWLRQIFPNVEKELLKGCTPYFNSHPNIANTADVDLEIHPYQKLTVDTVENSQGIGVWLAVHTNNAPVLVVSTISPHDDDWCEHVDQYLILYIPKRQQNSNILTWSEMKRVYVKACVKTMSTNPFNKSMFAGSTMDGDIYIWNYEQKVNSVEVAELHNDTLMHGYAVAMDWSSEQTLLTAHSNGLVVQWRLGTTEFMKESE